MRRKPGSLIPIEEDILDAALSLRRRGMAHFHGFLIAKQVQEGTGSKALTSHGTLYKALDRLERAGLVSSTWEEAEEAAAQGRPRRRLYEVTIEGERALARCRSGRSARVSRLGTMEA